MSSICGHYSPNATPSTFSYCRMFLKCGIQMKEVSSDSQKTMLCGTFIRRLFSLVPNVNHQTNESYTEPLSCAPPTFLPRKQVATLAKIYTLSSLLVRCIFFLLFIKYIFCCFALTESRASLYLECMCLSFELRRRM